MTPDQCPELNRPSKHSNDILKLSVRMWLFESNTNNCKHVYEKLINPFLSGKVLASSSPARKWRRCQHWSTSQFENVVSVMGVPMLFTRNWHWHLTQWSGNYCSKLGASMSSFLLTCIMVRIHSDISCSRRFKLFQLDITIPQIWGGTNAANFFMFNQHHQ